MPNQNLKATESNTADYENLNKAKNIFSSMVASALSEKKPTLIN